MGIRVVGGLIWEAIVGAVCGAVPGWVLWHLFTPAITKPDGPFPNDGFLWMFMGIGAVIGSVVAVVKADK